ncbi:MAG: YqiA/YcfP family alpha/beta fold hydrolase [Polyangiaceae bacterium]|jgi:alpha-beta hydrolase superfamily lysophospholipase
MPALAPKILYLHGFGSGPMSKKAMAFKDFARDHDASLERLDLRRPSFERLRLSAMIEHTVARIGGPAERVVLVGSSLGGLTACRVAERDARVGALVLLAPAFGLRTLWEARLGREGLSTWETTGALEVDDYVSGTKATVDYGFYLDLAAHDPEVLPDVRVPTVIVHGLRDEVVPVERSRAFARGRPNVRLVEVDDGHELAESLPRVLAEAARHLAPWGLG